MSARIHAPICATTLATDNCDSKNTNCEDAYQDIVFTESRHRNLDDFELLWLRVSASKGNVVLSIEG